jgi:L-alanine-DL-glutamate epimerase-like enolase superfamily enzyme
MKITHVTTRVLSTPADNPLVVGLPAPTDLVRVGGITQWMKVAGMAEAFNLPVVSHLVPEIHVHLVAAVPNGLTVEYMPWTLRFFAETPALAGGQLAVPKKPGLGLTLDPAAIKRYQVG